MLIAWMAVGTPITTTRLLWFLQDVVATMGEGVSDQDYSLRPEIEQERKEQEAAHDDYQGYYSETKRKVGSSFNGEYDSR